MPIGKVETSSAQQASALSQASAANAGKTEGSFAGRSVQQEASPRPRNAKLLALKSDVKVLFERLRGNEGRTGLVPKDEMFSYESSGAKAHVADALNELGASRPRPKELLTHLYLAAGCKDGESQAGFDDEYQKAMTESLGALPEHQLYRMQQRLGKLMGGYEDALRQQSSSETADAAEKRVTDGLHRTGDKLAQLRESIDSELKSRGYTVREPRSEASAQTRQETIDALGKFGSGRVTIGQNQFTQSQLQKIEAGLNDVRAQQESRRSSGESIDPQFAIDFNREELHLEGEFGMSHVSDEIKNIPEDDREQQLAHVTGRLSDLCNGDETQMYRLSSLLTQTSTIEAHTMLTITREGEYAAIRPPIETEGDTGIAGDTKTRFEVRHESDDSLSVAMRCNMKPSAISTTEWFEAIPVDTRESSLSYQLLFRLHNDGRVEVAEGHYNYHLQT